MIHHDTCRCPLCTSFTRPSKYRVVLFGISVILVVFSITTNILWSRQLLHSLSPPPTRSRPSSSIQVYKYSKSDEWDHSPVRKARRKFLLAAANRPRVHNNNQTNLQLQLVQPGDTVYTRVHNHSHSGFSPIVLEAYQLVFFALPPATMWKRLFRRMLGYQDWNSDTVDPHDPATNGLNYLYDFNLSHAHTIMTSPLYTRAIFVRDPLERFHHLFHEIILPHNGAIVQRQCCRETQDCFPNVTPEQFVEFVDRTGCQSIEWASIAQRMEAKYWKYVNFVGHWDHVDRDAIRLLEQLGIWNLFGASGWGKSGTLSFAEQLMRTYQPRRRWQSIQEFYNTNPSRKVLVNQFYRQDYEIPILEFSRFQLVRPTDFIYAKQQPLQWDAAPVVIERFKLIFFTVPKNACTTWKMLFRRIHGAPNYQDQNEQKGIPHDPTRNGLRYLWHYSLEQANEIMTSPHYTRAIFLRDPKERFLSAYLDKVVASPDFVRRKCCPNATSPMVQELACSGQVLTTIEFLTVIQECNDDHWIPQHRRMEEKYWPFINFVGHHDTLQADAQRLLQHLGAWEDYGHDGWGPTFQSPFFEKGSNKHQTHTTDSKEKYAMYFTPELEQRVEEFYAMDYANPKFGFQRNQS